MSKFYNFFFNTDISKNEENQKKQQKQEKQIKNKTRSRFDLQAFRDKLEKLNKKYNVSLSYRIIPNTYYCNILDCDEDIEGNNLSMAVSELITSEDIVLPTNLMIIYSLLNAPYMDIKTLFKAISKNSPSGLGIEINPLCLGNDNSKINLIAQKLESDDYTSNFKLLFSSLSAEQITIITKAVEKSKQLRKGLVLDFKVSDMTSGYTINTHNKDDSDSDSVLFMHVYNLFTRMIKNDLAGFYSIEELLKSNKGLQGLVLNLSNMDLSVQDAFGLELILKALPEDCTLILNDMAKASYTLGRISELIDCYPFPKKFTLDFSNNTYKFSPLKSIINIFTNKNCSENFVFKLMNYEFKIHEIKSIFDALLEKDTWPNALGFEVTMKIEHALCIANILEKLHKQGCKKKLYIGGNTYLSNSQETQQIIDKFLKCPLGISPRQSFTLLDNINDSLRLLADEMRTNNFLETITISNSTKNKFNKKIIDYFLETLTKYNYNLTEVRIECVTEEQENLLISILERNKQQKEIEANPHCLYLYNDDYDDKKSRINFIYQ
jgi:hypothetical protein